MNALRCLRMSHEAGGAPTRAAVGGSPALSAKIPLGWGPMERLTLTPFEKPFRAKLSPPGSKSLTNRALVMAVLADGPCTVSNVLVADDTVVMMDNLRRLGFTLDASADGKTLTIQGLGSRIPMEQAELFCGNSGTTIRFLTALCALGRGVYTLDGVARMRQRPIGALTGMLKSLGVAATHAPGSDGYPPVQVMGNGLPGARISYGSEVSSQYLSAVLMVAPYAQNEVQVDLVGPQTSWPYIAMTMQLMDTFGVTPELMRDKTTGVPSRIIVPQERYAKTDYTVEPDASAATYFLATAAVRQGASVTIENLGKRSLQGDVGFADVLHKMGADLVFGKDFITVTGTGTLEGIDADFSTMPDAAMTLATVALFAAGPTTIRGLHTLRVKETDRLAALQAELTSLGATATIDGDTLTIEPPATIKPAEIKTYDDHRMAMAFAVAGTVAAGVTIMEPECVNKTYPGFFADLERLREE
jgi:3-phosphoshikimate 1-carboxyvinyltransferase